MTLVELDVMALVVLAVQAVAQMEALLLAVDQPLAGFMALEMLEVVLLAHQPRKERLAAAVDTQLLAETHPLIRVAQAAQA